MDELILRVVALMLLLPAALFLAYNLGLAAFAFRRTAQLSESSLDASSPRFAIVIPAHDEEGTIGATLDACGCLDFPKDRFEVVVVADNCADATAELVRGRGIRCLQRQDRTRIGKGFALRFAFDQLLEEPFDAVVVLDADCRLDSDALRRFAAALGRGHRVLQANYRVTNPDASPISYALAVGGTIENELYYRPKSLLGLVVVLRGTGMVFAADVLRRRSWDSYSLAEDLDYSLALYAAGESVHFLADTFVRVEVPETAEQLRVQRGRWAGGNAEMGRSRALGTLLSGLRRGRLHQIDGALTIYSQSRPLQLLLVAGGTLFAAVGQAVTRDPWLVVLAQCGLLISAGYAAYILAGVLRLGLSQRRLRLLLATPGVVVQLTWIALSALSGRASRSWVRTPRS